MKHEEFLKLIKKFKQDKRNSVKWLDENELSSRIELFNYVKNICNYRGCEVHKDSDGLYRYYYGFKTIGGYEVEFISLVDKSSPYDEKHAKSICRHLDEIHISEDIFHGDDNIENIYSISKLNKDSKTLSVNMKEFRTLYNNNKFLYKLSSANGLYNRIKTYLEDENNTVIVFTVNKNYVEIKFRGIVSSILNKYPNNLKEYSDEIVTKIMDNIFSITIYPDNYKEKDTLINTFIER